MPLDRLRCGEWNLLVAWFSAPSCLVWDSRYTYTIHTHTNLQCLVIRSPDFFVGMISKNPLHVGSTIGKKILSMLGQLPLSYQHVGEIPFYLNMLGPDHLGENYPIFWDDSLVMPLFAAKFPIICWDASPRF